MHMNKQRGFSLIELMVVVVIIGLLSSFAYSSYQKSVTDSRRSDAKSALSQLTNVQEKFFTQCNRYAADLSANAADFACGTAAAPGNAILTFPVLSPEGHYAITVLAPVTAGCTTSNCYLLQADPAGPGASGLQATDGRFRIDHTGRKSWDKNGSGVTDANGMFTDGRWSDKKL